MNYLFLGEMPLFVLEEKVSTNREEKNTV